MNHTIKGVAIKRFHDDSHGQFREHLAGLIVACNSGRSLKILKRLTPHDFVCGAWTSQPERFTPDPLHQTPGRDI
jgi:hypothetical protein